MAKAKFHSAEAPVILFKSLSVSYRGLKGAQVWEWTSLYSPQPGSCISIREFRIFKRNFKRILDALGFLMRDTNSETRANAFFKPAVDVWRDLHCVLDWVVFALTEPSARKLQTVGISVPSLRSLISSLQSVLNQERIDLNITSNISKEACEIAGVKELTMPRVAEVEVYRDNVCDLPYVDGLSCSLVERFSDNPSVCLINKPIKIDETERLYSLDNVDSEVSPCRSSLSSEVNHESSQGLLLSAQDYPTIESDQSFSRMKRVKTRLRSAMTSDRLSALCVFHSGA